MAHDVTPTAQSMLPLTGSFLGRAARLLSSSSAYLDALKQTIDAALPELGDFGFFDAVDGDQVRRTAAAHEDPATEALLAQTQWVRQDPGEMNLCALSSGQPALHTGIDDAWYRRVAQSKEHLELLRRLAFRSMVTVPMRYRDQVVGALTLFMARSGRMHSELELQLAQELAAMAAPTIVNVRLAELYENAQAALSISESRLRLATEAGELGIWDWDVQQDRVTWSETVYRLHGLPPGRFGGRAADFAALVHPDDLPGVQQRIRHSLESGEPYVVEFRIVWPDGSVHWLAAQANVQRDEAGRPLRMIGATMDVTARVAALQAEREAREQAEHARHRLEMLAAASARLAGSLQPAATMRAIAETLVPEIADWCRIDVIDASGRLVRGVSYHADPEKSKVAEALVQRLRAADSTIGSIAWCVRTGRPFTVNHDSPEGFAASGDADLLTFARAIGMRAYSLTPLVARGRTLGALGILQAESGRCITADDVALLDLLAKRAALALDNARLYSEAEQARQQAEEASRAKDEFLAMLGHELRNPLAPIVTTLKVMALRDRDAFRHERSVIERQVAHLSRLVDDLLDVARIARGDVRLRLQPLPIRELIGRAVETASPLLERKRHRLRVHAPQAELHCRADEGRLIQVLSNLLNNAARYTPDGGLIEVRVEADGPWCRVSVSDNGDGIPADILPKVFELFYQGPQKPDRAGGGLGIGLALVKNLVQLQGGTVSAHSDGPGLGSEFVVRLRLCEPPAAAETARPADALPAPSAEAAADARRVLVVDDNRDALDSLAALLAMDGHEVRRAADAAEALALADDFRADVAILDIGLPGMDGYELAARLRSHPNFATCRLVALSGYGLQVDRQRSVEAGFAEHLVKPVGVDSLLQALRQR